MRPYGRLRTQPLAGRNGDSPRIARATWERLLLGPNVAATTGQGLRRSNDSDTQQARHLWELSSARRRSLPPASPEPARSASRTCRSGLEASGYNVSVGQPIATRPPRNRDTVHRSSVANRQARVELLEYASEYLVHEDWILASGQSPARATPTLPAARLYWNGDSILVVDFRAPNDAGVASAAGDSSSVAAAPGWFSTSTAAGTQTDGGFTPPATGDAGLIETTGTRPAFVAAARCRRCSGCRPALR